MYQVFKNSRKTKHTFETYEAARQWVRKQLRKLIAYRYFGQPDASMSEYGFQIRKFN
jgi:hypothetical protein